MKKRNQIISSLIAIAVTTSITNTCAYAKDEEINDAISIENQENHNNELDKNTLELNQSKVTTGAAAFINPVENDKVDEITEKPKEDFVTNEITEKPEEDLITVEDNTRTLDEYLKSKMPRNSRRVKRYASFSFFESNKEEIKERIKNGIENCETNIDIKDLINLDDIKNNSSKVLDLYFDVMYENPQFFYCSPTSVKFSNCAYNPSSGELKSCDIEVTYEYSNDVIDKMKDKLNSKINDIKENYLDECSTELEIEYAIHDYITQNCTYDKDNYDKKTVPNISHTSYGALVNEIAVCDGYSKANMLLLNEYGIEAGIVTNSDHAWNYVNIDGNYYQTDLTWDDPTPETNKIMYKNFNCSDSVMYKIHPWTSTIPGNCIDTTFDNLFRTVNGTRVNGKNAVRIKNKLYYLVGTDLWKCDLNGTNKSLLKQNITQNTTMLNLTAHNKDIYYLSELEIKKININSGEIETFKNLSDEFNFIIGSYSVQFYIKDNKLNVKFGQSQTNTNLTYSTKEYELDDVEDVDTDNTYIDNSEEKAQAEEKTQDVIKLNKSNLQGLYNDNKGKLKGNYTDETWNVFLNSLNEAKYILDRDDITQIYVDNALLHLQTAINNLKEKSQSEEKVQDVIKTNKSNLQTLYNDNKNKLKSNYTDETWNVFLNSLNEAKYILDRDDITQIYVDNALLHLQIAINNLKEKAQDVIKPIKQNTNTSSGGGSRGGNSSGGGSSKNLSENKLDIKNQTDIANATKININDSSNLNIVNTVKNVAKTLTGINNINKEISLDEIYEINNGDVKGTVASLKSDNNKFIYISCKSTTENSNINPIKVDTSELNSTDKYLYKLDNITNKLVLINNIQENLVEIQAKNQDQYILSNTQMQSLTNNNWNKINNDWLYVKNGQVVTGWIKTLDNKWYHMNNQGMMQKGWIKDNNKWYHLSNNGHMDTGWFKNTDGNWYYLNRDGSMKTGWLKDYYGNWYYLKPNGSMAVNTRINGYYINKSGLWQ
ncbi:transglutaminase domain-containing protein [Clostridium taeniosporum]|uniref:Sugar-binding protein n=1 Tax=Clostridium taeniosporum TaxID=394958 RepID=A0A1D7XKB0_9CLOT|nr:transglutaminase domain-containing protein [Clostridium taeniosporum]AOR23776.1 sugar-binding protein [Clostridium taeniosporum]